MDLGEAQLRQQGCEDLFHIGQLLEHIAELTNQQYLNAIIVVKGRLHILYLSPLFPADFRILNANIVRQESHHGVR